MGKSPAPAADSAADLRSIPSVERILSGEAVSPLVSRYGRERVKEAVVTYLDTLRAGPRGYDEAAAIAAIGAALEVATSSTLCRTINGTGVIIHTNLGRAPIDRTLWSEAAEVVSGYANLEFDLSSGERGSRNEHLTQICRSLFGCESAVLANNNAAATMLALAALAAGREVLVSRGELVEIGGGFRVPEVIQQGGAILREVGTTNRTRASDYAAALSERTAAILRVHRSNFDLVGFTETPAVADLIEVARSGGVPLLYDEGSGCVVDLSPYGLSRKETIAELFAAGVDLITCSTDKLIGATQGGLILGRADLVERCRRHPLMRAIRAGKESYAIVGATLRAFATGRHEQQIPIYEMLSTTLPALRTRGEQLIAGTQATLVDSRCALGGGTTPNETIDSLAIAVPGDATSRYDALLSNDPPIVGRIQNDRLTIDLRTLLEDDQPFVRKVLLSS